MIATLMVAITVDICSSDAQTTVTTVCTCYYSSVSLTSGH